MYLFLTWRPYYNDTWYTILLSKFETCIVKKLLDTDVVFYILHVESDQDLKTWVEFYCEVKKEHSIFGNRCPQTWQCGNPHIAANKVQEWTHMPQVELRALLQWCWAHVRHEMVSALGRLRGWLSCTNNSAWYLQSSPAWWEACKAHHVLIC